MFMHSCEGFDNFYDIILLRSICYISHIIFFIDSPENSKHPLYNVDKVCFIVSLCHDLWSSLFLK